MYATVIAAYGRTYTTAKAAKADWDAGKDFRMVPEGCYVTKKEAKENGLSGVIIRYGKNQAKCTNGKV